MRLCRGEKLGIAPSPSTLALVPSAFTTTILESEFVSPSRGRQATSAMAAIKREGKETSVLWCRDTTNNWMTELRDGKPPVPVKNFSLDLKQFLPVKGAATVSVYDPWLDKWSTAKLKNGKIVLPEFRRSVVVRLDN